MGTAWKLNQGHRNRLLALLPKEEFDSLLPHLEQVILSVKDRLYEINQPIQAVYFPLSVVVSLVTIMRNGTRIEVATVGNEGMVGMPSFFGSDRAPIEAFCQIPGDALKLPATQFREALERGSQFRLVLNLYAQALLDQMGQLVACNRVHNLEQRCSCWLLMSHDRVGQEAFPMTQEFLGHMLGAEPAAVHQVLTSLQEKDLICFANEIMTLKNRSGLEQTACECYAVIRLDYERFLGG
jgi:CRP-like cAMP-binding protein